MARGALAAGIWVIATGTIILGLYEGRDILAPFALAVFIWTVMQGFGSRIGGVLPQLPGWAAQALSIVLTAGAIILFVAVFSAGIRDFALHSDGYEARINTLIADVYRALSLDNAPTLSKLIFSDASKSFLQPIWESVGGLASDILLIMIYIAFLYLASSSWKTKMDHLFLSQEGRDKALDVTRSVRRAMEEYVWVQTVISLILTFISYITLIVLGLDNSLFWAFIIFFLNYIPTIGSVLAAALPALFAFAQPDWPAWMPQDPAVNALVVFAAISVWQFGVGNFVQPRMMGQSLNISAVVVLLSLAVWGALWGVVGMFLSAPLTVLIMILLAQTPGARWIAVLMSDNGDPGGRLREAGPGAPVSDPK